MKTLFVSTFFLFSFSAFAQPLTPFVLQGKNSIGEPCFLVVEEWNYEPADTESWETLSLVVRTNWQYFDHPPVTIKPSATPWALYGINKQTYDQFAVQFDVNQLDPSGIRNFLFQTYSEVDGTIQHSCRFY